MNIFRKAFQRLRKWIGARYEAAVTSWGDRSFLFSSNQDARLDADAMSRKEIMRKSRYFERNNAFVNRMADLFEQYTVGPNGLQVVSESKDATEYFARWGMQCDATGLMTFPLMQSVAARGWFVDGGSFLVKVIVRGRLKVQLIEAHRVYTPPFLAREEGKIVIDGKGVDRFGCVTGIWIFKGNNDQPADDPEHWSFVGTEDFIDISEPNRAGMYRGLPMLYPVMNDLHDLDDLQMLTMQVAKQAAEIGNVTTNKTGELSTETSRRAKLNFQSTSAAGSALTKSSGEYYKVSLGAREIALQTGDSIKQFQAERPSLAEREHWDYLTSKVCTGVGISKLLVMPYSMQGTVTRADLDIAAAFFRARSAVMQAAVARVFLWVIEWAQLYDREVLRGGFNFAGYERVTVRPPRSVNVDVGRNSNALIAELEAHVRTYQSTYAEMGEDWREAFTQIAAEKQFAASLGITLADVQQSLQQRQQEEPEEAKTK